MLICPSCRGWRRHALDRFCGGCGASFLALGAEASPQYTFGSGAGPESVTVTLHSRGPIDPAGTWVVLRDGGTGAEIARQAIASDVLACQGDAWTFAIDLPPAACAGRWRGELVHVPSEREEGRLLCRLEYGLPEPELVMVDDTLEPVCAADGSARTVLRLALRRGDVAPVAAVALEGFDAEDAGSAPIVEMPSSPVPLYPEETLALRLHLPPPAVARLLQHHAGARLSLAVTIADKPDIRHLPFVLRFSTPPFPEATIPPRLAGLAGRTAHLSVTVENNGGSPCTLSGVAAHAVVDEARSISANRRFEGGGAVLSPGEARRLDLRLPLRDAKGTAFPERTYFCDVEITFAEPELPAIRRKIALEVRPARAFDGYIAIDFGTTESAVAYVRHGQAERPSTLRLEPDGTFTPTAIAYVVGPGSARAECFIGHEAYSRSVSAGPGAVLFLDNLKWRIQKPESVTLPDGRSASWVDIAADYLRCLKERIEEHPEIAALVDAVYATRPARFGSPATISLCSAFERAGMTPMEVSVAGGGQAVLSESWSPLVLALPLPHLAPLQQDALETAAMLGPEGVGTHHLLTYDVGGGSTDLSLFRADIRNRATATILETASDGTTTLCGNAIAALLFDHLAPSLDRWLSRRGLSRRRIPYHLPWEEMPAGGVDPRATANGRALARLLGALQHGPGGPFFHLLNQFAGARPLETLFDPADQDVRQWLSAYQERHLSALTPEGTPLRLETTDGTRLSIPWGADGLILDLPGFMTDFVGTMERPMAGLLGGLLGALGEEDEPLLHLLVTGRGSLFPLINPMLRKHIRDRIGGRVTLWRVAFDYLKNITSLGAVFLTDVTLNMTGIAFHSRTSSLFGIAGDVDPLTGHRMFLPLCPGIPQPEAGPIAVRRPLPPGNLERRIELGSANREGDVRSAGFRTELVVSGRVALTAQQAANAHVVVHAKREHCLTVAIASPFPDAAAPPDGEWMTYTELGSVALVAGACRVEEPAS